MTKMIELTQAAPERSDCTAPYTVTLHKEYTVREFVNEIVSNEKDWGYIGIADGKNWSRGTPHCEYRWGELLSTLPEEIMDRTIESATADGGWSAMDYKLVLKKESA